MTNNGSVGGGSVGDGGGSSVSSRGGSSVSGSNDEQEHKGVVPQRISSSSSNEENAPQQHPEQSISSISRSHVRGDSMYSIESFVIDTTSIMPDDAGGREDQSHQELSVTSEAETDAEAAEVPDGAVALVTENQTSLVGLQEQQQHHHETIDHSRQAPNRTNSSDSMGSLPPPANPFFHGLYDSDNEGLRSDTGSIVFNYTPPSGPSATNNETIANASLPPQQLGLQQPPPPQQQTSPVGAATAPNRRDRFPSFDSVGSSGTLVKKLPGPPARSTTPSAAAPQTTASAAAAPVNIQTLPYHERRKLMQQRQIQQQKQQQQQAQQRVPGRDKTPPRPGRTSGVAPSPQQQQQQQQQHVMMNIPPPPPQGPYSMPPPPPQQTYYPPYPPPHQQYGGGGGFPPPPHNYPYPPPPPQSSGMQYPHAAAYGQQQQQQQQQRHGPPPPPPYQQQQRRSNSSNPYHQAPPNMGEQAGRHQSGSSRNEGGFGQSTSYMTRPPIQRALPPYQQHQQQSRSRGSDPHSNWQQQQQQQANSSFDSSDGDTQQQQLLPVDPRSGPVPPRPSRRKDVPPPPPPTAPPATHVRQDSSGSVSSLGSFGQSGMEDNNGKGGRGSQRGFFDRINPWSAPPQGHEHDVSNFHKKNQAFLNKVKPKNIPASPSPRTIQRRVPVNSQVRRQPPPSSGGHRRLNSIENDDWTETGDEDEAKDPLLLREQHREDPKSTRKSDRRTKKAKKRAEAFYSHNSSSSSSQSSSSDDDIYERYDAADERTRLLPAAGISTNEYSDSLYRSGNHGSASAKPNTSPESLYGSGSHSSGQLHISPDTSADSNRATFRVNNTAAALREYENLERSDRGERAKKKKRKKRRSRNKRSSEYGGSPDSSNSSTSMSSHEYHLWKEQKTAYLEREKARVIAQWHEEAKAQAEQNRWDRRAWRYLVHIRESVGAKVFTKAAWTEAFFANLPISIGAIALSAANLGVDWFKFAEENMASCQPVHFHSKQCTFPEFPGCFYCDTHTRVYEIALNFHFFCSCLAGVIAFSFVAKIILARRVVYDELSNPTTAAPAGLLCMTFDVVFAGRGMLGMGVVCAASFVHLCIAAWFMYMALAYHIMPEPSWFPNTTGIGLSAVKLWLYYPMAGHFLMAISISLNFFFFPVSLVRVITNKKISATTGWMQMSAPNLSLYSLTIMAQPSFLEENPDINSFQKIHRMVYLPCMHLLFTLCIVGMIASVTSLVVRWKSFRKQPFSPAYASFCCPILSHANAIQAYRAAVNSFSELPSDTPFLIFLYAYWVVVLIGGTFVTLVVATRYVLHLPEWTHFDLDDDIEPPAPYQTAMSMTNMVASGETLVQPFVSPAILQANETGSLVFTRDRQGNQRYVRTRKVTALGFEPMMDIIEMEQERELLLEWVGRNAPRRRNRTLSVPGIDFTYSSGGSDFGSRNQGVYGMEEGLSPAWARRRRDTETQPRRQRSNTLSPAFRARKSGY